MTFRDEYTPQDKYVPDPVPKPNTPKVKVQATFGKETKAPKPAVIKPKPTVKAPTPEQSFNTKYTYSTDNVLSILNWEDYSFTMDFMLPSNSFRFHVGQSDINYELVKKLTGGQLISLSGVTEGSSTETPIMNGYIDGLEIRSSRSGSYIDLHGRNFLGIICDSQIDPWCNKFKFTEATTLKEALAVIFADFDIRQFYLSNDQNRSLLTGVDASKVIYKTETLGLPPVDELFYGVQEGAGFGATANYYYKRTREDTRHTVTTAIDPTIPSNLKNLNKNLQSIKPHFGESYLAFAERLCRRFGLHIWGNATGDGIIIGKPDYEQSPMYTFTNVKSGIGNNIISSAVEFNYNKMPTLIVAKGFGSGKVKNADVAYQRIKCAKTNDFLVDPDQPTDVIQNLIAQHPSLQLMPATESRRKVHQLYSKYFDATLAPRVIYVEDTNSKSNSEIENFISRVMSERQREAMTIHLTVQDHQQDGKMYSVDTVATVNDETLGINAPFWVQSVTYKKSRSSGTITELVLIPLYSMEFGDEE